jgi:hypothetical protein
MYNIFEKYSDFVFESNIDEVLNIIKNQMKEDKTGKKVETSDFILKIDDMTNHVTLSWIYTKTRTYSGTDIIRALIKYAQEKNYKFIAGYGIKGFDIVEIEGKKTRIVTNGYYSLMRWGFLPDKGIKVINKKLKTNYATLEDAFSDSSFWTTWKDNGGDYTGEFDLKPNSLSFKVLDKQL